MPEKQPPPDAVSRVAVHRRPGGDGDHDDDHVAREEPLEIRVLVPTDGLAEKHSVAVTMRTPGHDAELAAGFLFTEGLLQNPDHVARIHPATTTSSEAFGNLLNVELKPGVPFDAPRAARHAYTTSSCGICGKASLELVRTACPTPPRGDSKLNADMLQGLPAALETAQPVFGLTGGIHGAALFTPEGTLVSAAEDVGRHNAVDKLVGRLFLDGGLPAHDHVLLVSGRAGFELVQKAAMAGIPTLAAVGAPSSLAVELAREFDMTLVGFLKPSGCNVYSGPERLTGDPKSAT